MNSRLKKTLGIIGAVIGLILVSCGLTSCNFFDDDSGVQPNSSTPTTGIPGLPPDPGEGGKATLAGIDKDNDGVRDDVQRYIAMTYPNSAKTRAALTQYTKQLQGAILDASSKELSMKHAEEYDKVLECGVTLLGFRAYYEAEKDLKPLVLNTEARTMAYLQYDDHLGGEVFPDNTQGAAACDVDVTTFSN